MFGFSVNLLAVLVSAVVAFLFGWLWYSPALFMKTWMRLSGQKSMGDGSMSMGLTMTLGFIVTLIMAFVLANVIKYVGVAGIFGGITAAFWMWLGFIGTTSLNLVLYEKKPFALYLLNNCHILLSLVIMGIILSVW